LIRNDDALTVAKHLLRGCVRAIEFRAVNARV